MSLQLQHKHACPVNSAAQHRRWSLLTGSTVGLTAVRYMPNTACATPAHVHRCYRMLDSAEGAGHSTPSARDVGGAKEDAPAAFRSPSPEDADAVRVGSPREDGEDTGDQQQATPQRSVGPNSRAAASPADAAMGSAPDGGMEAVAADAALPQDTMPAVTPASRAGFPGFALGRGQHLVLSIAKPLCLMSIFPPGWRQCYR